MTLVILTAILAKTAFAFDDNDTQYWNTESISWRFGEGWGAKIEEEFRFGDDAQNFYYQHSDFGFTCSGLADWFILGANYRQIFEKKKGIWKQENRPHINGTVKFKLQDMAISNRGRFEYRHREDADNLWRYRNKISVKLPMALTEFKLQPYIADEIFLDFDKEELDRNRVYIGFFITLSENIKGDLFYLWQTSKSNGTWTDYHIGGTKAKLSF